MKILYIYRNQSLGFSIAKVFRPIEEEMRKYAEVDSVYLPEAGAMPWQLWKNIKAARYAVKGGGYRIFHKFPSHTSYYYALHIMDKAT